MIMMDNDEDGDGDDGDSNSNNNNNNNNNEYKPFIMGNNIIYCKHRTAATLYTLEI
jgi:hypothetical protein